MTKTFVLAMTLCYFHDDHTWHPIRSLISGAHPCPLKGNFASKLERRFFRGVQNVLHWHTVDYQSFPLEVPSFPKLWDGAYTRYEKYSYADVADVVE